MVDVGKNVQKAVEEVKRIISIYGRDEDEVTILAATKYGNSKQIEELVGAGIKVIGENRLQDAKVKFSNLNIAVRKHFIGHLQSNKVREVVGLFDCIESVDSEKLLGVIYDEAGSQHKVVDVYIEVNIAGDDNKFGLRGHEVISLVEKSLKMKNLRVIGLMTIIPIEITNEMKEKYFAKMKILFDDAKMVNGAICELSMGMSQDFELAIKHGSTEVRIGSLLFQDN